LEGGIVYYSPGVFPNYHEIGTREKDIPDQQLEPIEDYSEMTEEEIKSKAESINNNSSLEQKIKILSYAIEGMPATLYGVLKDNCPCTLLILTETLIREGEL
jgi:hypothetical protein